MPRFKLPETSRVDGIAREAERRAITGVATSTWYVLMADGRAPRPIRLGTRAVGWDRRSLFEWLETRKAERADTWQTLGEAAQRVVEKTRP
jgi:prophage regulatory protein